MQRFHYDSPPLNETSDELLHAADQEDKDRSPPKAAGGFASWNVLNQIRRQRATFPPSWLTATVLLGYLAILAVCWHGQGKRTSLGVLPRRLAGSEEDESGAGESPASRGLSAFCKEAAGWSPAEAEPRAPRHSPLMVQEFLETIEQEGDGSAFSVSGSPPPVVPQPYGAGDAGGGATKRPAPSPSDSDDEDPGPSWKAAKYAHPPQQTRLSPAAAGGLAAAVQMASTQELPARGEGSPFHLTTLTGGTQRPSATGDSEGPSTSGTAAAGAPRASFPPGRGPERFPLLHSLLIAPSTAAAAAEMSRARLPPATKPEESPALRAILTGDPAMPSTSTAASGQVTVQQAAAAPSARLQSSRLPTLQPEVRPRAWMTPHIFGAPCKVSVSRILLTLRELLRLSSLNSQQTNLLVESTENLANHVVHHMTQTPAGMDPVDAVRFWGLRFLALNALYSAAQVLGPDRPPWWNKVLAVIPNGPAPSVNRFMPLSVRNRVNFLNRIIAALEMYKSYTNPGDEEAFDLLRILFCGEESCNYFRKKSWGPWKDDFS